MGKERTYLVLWMTGKCNLKCKYCYAYGEGQQEDMDFAVAKAALDYFKGTPLKIQFTGGEPLLNYDLIRAVYDYAQGRNDDVVFQLQTNGTLINEAVAAGIKKMRISTGVSLDGPFAVNEQQRGGTKSALEGIRYLGRQGVMINLNSTVTAQNVDRLPEMMDLALYLGNVAGIGLDLIRFSGRARERNQTIQKPEEKQLIKAIRGLYEESRYLYENTGVSIGVRPIEEARKRMQCKNCSKNYCYASCGKSYVILPNGDVYPCGSLKDRKEYYLGNVSKGEIKTMSLPSLPENENCAACRYQAYCPGACPSRIITNGYTSADDSLDCIMRKTAFAIAEEELVRKNLILNR